MIAAPSRHVQFAYFLEKTSDAARVTAQDMLCIAALDLIAGTIAALADAVSDHSVNDYAPGQREQLAVLASKIEHLRSRAFAMLPTDKDGRLALGPSDMHWYKRTSQRLRKILKRQWGDAVDARELVMAAMLVCEQVLAGFEKWKVDARDIWGRLCESTQELYEAYDPELTAQQCIDKGAAIGEMMAKSVFK